jgi:peptidoglycan/xylan/chitin deacetylase (PgdA/CDA1 family)
LNVTLLKTKTNLKQSIWLVLILSSLMAGCIARLDEGNPRQQLATESAEFMLSFDDGPLPNTTERILDILATLTATDGTPVKAGFFLLADAPDEFWQQRSYYAPYELWTNKGSIAKYPKIVQRIKEAGHTIGNHSTHHPWLRWPWLDTPETVQDEISQWETIAKPILGHSNLRLYRPPYFILNATVRETAHRLGYQIVMGESVGDAIPDITLAAIQQKTLRILSAWDKPYPCLLVFHDNRPATYLHLDEIVINLQQQGFRLVHFDSTRL